MVRTTRLWLIPVSVSGLLSAAAALAADPTPQQMMEQIHQLQAKVEKLEANQTAGKEANHPTTPAISAENSSASVEADANHRSQFLDISNPFTAGWDGKEFILRSENGDFTLHPGVVLDIRNMTTFRQSIPAKGGGETNSTGYDTQNGFDLSRARLTLDGTIDHNIGYFFQVSSDQGAPLSLLDAYATYRFTESPFSIKVGQFKDPLFHERSLSEARLMAVDRSLLEYLLGGGQTSRVQGIALLYDKDRIRGQAMLHDGFDSINTKFFDAGGLGAGVGGGAGVTPTNFGASSRGEYLVLGDRSEDLHPFADYDGGFTSLGYQQNILVAGAGADFSQAGSNDVIFHTVDLQYNTANALSIYAAYLGAYRDLHTNQGVAPGAYYDPGFEFQVAYLFVQKIEPFARYDYTHLHPASVTGLASHVAQEITLGVNYYLYKQTAKVTLDGSFLPNGSPTDSDALGILKDSGNNEFVLRGQFQLAI
jgi:hypothetical protein